MSRKVAVRGGEDEDWGCSSESGISSNSEKDVKREAVVSHSLPSSNPLPPQSSQRRAAEEDDGSRRRGFRVHDEEPSLYDRQSFKGHRRNTREESNLKNTQTRPARETAAGRKVDGHVDFDGRNGYHDTYRRQGEMERSAGEMERDGGSARRPPVVGGQSRHHQLYYRRRPQEEDLLPGSVPLPLSPKAGQRSRHSREGGGGGRLESVPRSFADSGRAERAGLFTGGESGLGAGRSSYHHHHHSQQQQQHRSAYSGNAAQLQEEEGQSSRAVVGNRQVRPHPLAEHSGRRKAGVGYESSSREASSVGSRDEWGDERRRSRRRRPARRTPQQEAQAEEEEEEGGGGRGGGGGGREMGYWGRGGGGEWVRVQADSPRRYSSAESRRNNHIYHNNQHPSPREATSSVPFSASTLHSNDDARWQSDEGSGGDDEDWGRNNGSSGVGRKGAKGSGPLRGGRGETTSPDDGDDAFQPGGHRWYDTLGQTLSQINWDTTETTGLVKDFYIPHPAVENMTAAQVQQLRESKNISILDGADICPNPVDVFEHASLPPALDEAMCGTFKSPTAVQMQSWPIALKGLDLIAIAETGSGKTLGFLVPAFVHILSQPALQPGDGPICLVLAPTRELVMQIHGEATRFGTPVGVRSMCCYGGVPGSKRGQMDVLKQGREICIAAPGRLLDILQTAGTRRYSGCNLLRVTYFVLDEADRMLDQGFGPSVNLIVSQIRPDRQTLMWSATWNREVENMARTVFKDSDQKPVHMEIGNASAYKILPAIDQQFVKLESSTFQNRMQCLMKILNGSPGKKFLIFCDTKKNAESATVELRRKGIIAMSLHGDKEQTERMAALEAFKSGPCEALVATDVASRGLDVNDISVVVNFVFPGDMDTYVHRIGRTGRAGKTGSAVSFMSEMDCQQRLPDLQSLFHSAGLKIPDSLENLRK